MRKIYLSLFAISLFLPPGLFAYEVYDCNGDGALNRGFNTLQVGSCPHKWSTFGEEKDCNVYVLKLDTPLPVTGFKCLVTKTKEERQCADDNGKFLVQYSSWEDTIDIGPEECRQAASSGYVVVQGQSHKIELGKSTTISLEESLLEAEGWVCDEQLHPTPFNATLSGDYDLRISISTIEGIAYPHEGDITFQDGFVSDYQVGYLQDSHLGTIVWNSEPTPCERSVHDLYKGEAKLRMKYDRAVQGYTRNGSIILIDNDVGNDMTAFLLEEEMEVCGMKCHLCQISGVAVCFVSGKESFLPYGAFLTSVSNDISKTANVKMNEPPTYLDYKTFLLEMCHQWTLQQEVKKIQLLGEHADWYVRQYFGPGYQVHQRGMVTYLVKCLPVQAVLAHYHQCTKEVPISMHGKLAFADPATWVIVEHPTITSCSTGMTVRWQVNGRWYCTMTDIDHCSPPSDEGETAGDSNVTVNHENTWSWDDRRARFHYGRAMQSAGFPLTSLGHKWETVHEDVNYRKHGDLSPVSTLVHLFYIWSSIWVLQYIVGAYIRMRTTYRKEGCGMWTIGSAWSTIFSLNQARKYTRPSYCHYKVQCKTEKRNASLVEDVEAHELESLFENDTYLNVPEEEVAVNIVLPSSTPLPPPPTPTPPPQGTTAAAL